MGGVLFFLLFFMSACEQAILAYDMFSLLMAPDNFKSIRPLSAKKLTQILFLHYGGKKTEQDKTISFIIHCK